MAEPMTTTPATSTGARSESIADLIKELRDDALRLVRQEVALAETEISEKISRIFRNFLFLLAGVLVAFAGIILTLQALAALLGIALAVAGLEEHSIWLAPLIVGLIVAIIGWVLAQKGISAVKNESMVPKKTIHSLKEDKEWIQNKAI